MQVYSWGLPLIHGSSCTALGSTIGYRVNHTLVAVVSQCLKSRGGKIDVTHLASLALVLNRDYNAVAIGCGHTVFCTADGSIVGVVTAAKLCVPALPFAQQLSNQS